MLFRTQGRYFVKVDQSVIPVTDASCFTEAAEFLFMFFFVFWVEYPFELRLFYVWFEQIMGMKVSIKSSIVSDLNRRIARYLP